MPCWRLKASEEGKSTMKTKTPGQKYRVVQDVRSNYIHLNAQVRDIIFQLEFGYGYSASENQLTHRANRQPPFLDAIGITGRIDFTIDKAIMERIRSDRKQRDTFSDYRRLVESFGFTLERGYKKMKDVVIRDRI